MYQPQQNLCMLHTGNTAHATPEEVYASSVIFVEDPTVEGDPYPVGRVDAVSLSSGQTGWTHQQRAGMISGLVATGGGLVFGGDANRRFKALDDQTGEVLWETIVSGPVTGHPISYALMVASTSPCRLAAGRRNRSAAYSPSIPRSSRVAASMRCSFLRSGITRPEKMQNRDGKIILLTGASQGIGLATESGRNPYCRKLVNQLRFDRSEQWTRCVG